MPSSVIKTRIRRYGWADLGRYRGEESTWIRVAGEGILAYTVGAGDFLGRISGAFGIPPHEQEGAHARVRALNIAPPANWRAGHVVALPGDWAHTNRDFGEMPWAWVDP